jgi:putative transposase
VRRYGKMASMKRKQYEAAFKARVALEAVKGEKTIAQVASEYGVHPNQVRQWKEHLLSVLPELFSDRRKRTDEERDQVEAELYRQIGQLKVENEWLKKNFSSFGRREEVAGREG